MATAKTKRKALGSQCVPEKRQRVDQQVLSPDYHFGDKGSDEESQEDKRQIFDTDSNAADTPDTTFSPQKKFPSREKTLRCTFAGCTKTFNRPVRLATHLNTHNNERTFSCSFEGCDKAYFEQKHLNQHIKGSHTHERTYECNWEGCTKRFLTATRLRRHIETHEGHNRFRCKAYPPCNQSFRKHQTLQRHIRVDHLELAPFSCAYVDSITLEHCDAGFDSAAALRKHEGRMHGLPQFFCPQCTLPGINPDGSAIHLGFTTDNQLQSHIKKEHANCPFCDRKFSSQRELQKHVESQHSGTTLEERKNIPCTHEGCPKTFTKKYNRDIHVRTQHEGLRFICGTFDLSADPELAALDYNDACGKGFVSKANLEDHVRIAHLGLLSRINANRKNSARNSVDGIFDNNYGGEPKRKTGKSKGKHTKASMIDELLGLSYANDSRRNIPCLVTTCPHLFIRDYDLQQHMRSKHHFSTPEIENMANEVATEPEFQFPPGDMRNDDAYGEEGGEEDLWETGMAGSEEVPFWLGGNVEKTPIDQWAQDEHEMSRIIGETK